MGEDRQAIDREKVCPCLLRGFVQEGRHHSPRDYSFQSPGRAPTHKEVQIYTWGDATLKEMMTLIQTVNQSAQRASLSFAFVYPDRDGRAAVRKVGLTHASRRGADDGKQLRELGFQP